MSVKALAGATAAVATLRRLSKVIRVSETRDKMSLLQDRLNKVMHTAKPHSATAKGKGREVSPASALRASDLEQLYHRYQEEFCDDSADEEDQFIDGWELLTASVKTMPGQFTKGKSIGVAAEETFTTAELLKSLGFEGKEVLPFMNSVKHERPVAEWAAALAMSEARALIHQAHQADTPPAQWEILRLKWHQVAAVHAGARLFLEDTHGGILLADDVGVGKTCECLGILTLAIHRAEVEKQGGRRPPGITGDGPCSHDAMLHG
jgi:hypothetical protein